MPKSLLMSKNYLLTLTKKNNNLKLNLLKKFNFRNFKKRSMLILNWIKIEHFIIVNENMFFRQIN